ncbi:MAG: Ig-like domain-containing protein [Chloroflexota bacterium]
MRAPDAYRLKKAKGLGGRRRGVPFAARMLLVVALVVLGGAVFMTAGGGVGVLVGALSTSVTGFIDRVTATAQPTATELVAADAPVIALPTEPYTNLPTADLQVTVPSAQVGNTAARLRIYLTLEGQAPAPISEVPMGSTIRMVVPVELTQGRNDFHATIVEGGIESEPSPIVTFILDTDPPKIVLTSPKDGATVNRATATLTGTTQPRTTLLARNATNGTSISGQTGSDGAFALELPLENGTNAITITARDPAGNPGELALSVVRGSGALSSTLTASAYRISTSSLPVSIQLTVLVLDPDGAPLPGATITFTLTVPGIPPISKDAVSGGDGRATFTTTLPKDVTVGGGLATVLVATTQYGSTSAQKAITIVK